MESGRDATREAFLSAGVRLYGSMSDRLLRGFTAGVVSDEAGFRRQTFYRYWDTQADYVRDLILHLLSDHTPAADGAAVLPSRRGGVGDWGEMAVDIARYDYRRMASDPRVRMRIGLATMGGTADLGLAEEAQEYYTRVAERVQEAFDAVFEGAGVRARSPLTTSDLVRLHQAILVGLVVLELALDDGTASAELYERVFAWIGEALTEPVDAEAMPSSD